MNLRAARIVFEWVAEANAVAGMSDARPDSFPVTDDDLDAPDGAVVDGYERSGDRWYRLKEQGMKAEDYFTGSMERVLRYVGEKGAANLLTLHAELSTGEHPASDRLIKELIGEGLLARVPDMDAVTLTVAGRSSLEAAHSWRKHVKEVRVGPLSERVLNVLYELGPQAKDIDVMHAMADLKMVPKHLRNCLRELEDDHFITLIRLVPKISAAGAEWVRQKRARGE